MPILTHQLSHEMVKMAKHIAPGRRWQIGIRWIAFLGRMMFLSLGFQITVKGDLATPIEAPVLVFAPHSTYLDVIVWFWSCTFTGQFILPPYTVSRAENKKIPIFGNLLELSRSIHVARENPVSRKNAIKEIVRRSQHVSDSSLRAHWPQLIVSPEGTTSNGKALLYFKPGAFYPGKPIQPILIRYPNAIDTITWTW